MTTSPRSLDPVTAPADPSMSAVMRLRPSRWPIVVRLSAILVIATLLPMMVLGYINLQESLSAVKGAEIKTLRQLALTTAGRIDQFIRDTRYLISYFAWSKPVLAVTNDAGLPKDDAAELSASMERLMAANEDIELMMVLNRRGIVVASSKPEYHGRNLSFRDYFKEASAGREYLSPLEIGTASGRPGLYLSTPVRARTGLVAGVAVMKIRGEAVTRVLDAYGDKDREPFLVDGDGVILHHHDPALIYHSLMPLPPQLSQRITEEQRFGKEPVRSVDLPILAEALRNRNSPTAVEYPRDSVMRIAGVAPLATHNWTVVVEESHATFSRPLVQLFKNLTWRAVVLGVVAILFAVLLARSFVKPIQNLARAAIAVQNGSYADAKLKPRGGDELAALAITFNGMVDGIAARERERDIFGRVVSPDVREKLLSGNLTLGGENRRVSVLFSDIRGFSTLSEQMSPHDVVTFLNEYLTEMADAVKPWGGYINNFIGDAIVVVFGAPQEQSDIEWRAVAAALDMKARLSQLNQRRSELGDSPLTTGIGISTGKVVAGQVGSIERFLYTVIGDAVNVAARLEAMTKDVEGNPILVNAATYDAVCGRGEITATDMGPLDVKGRNAPVHVYAIAPRA